MTNALRRFGRTNSAGFASATPWTAAYPTVGFVTGINSPSANSRSRRFLAISPSGSKCEKGNHVDQETLCLPQAFSDLDQLIRGLSGPSREQACAITNLETAAMWAIKAVVFNDPSSEVSQGVNVERTGGDATIKP